MAAGEYNMAADSSLADLLAEYGPAAPGETMRILAEVAEALDDAHRRRIAYGHLTADRIRITAEGSAVLAGWPEAWDSVRPETVITNRGLVFSEAAAESDVYELAIIGHQCLTGRPRDPSAQVPPLPDHIPAAVAQAIGLVLGGGKSSGTPTAAWLARSCRDAAAGLGLTNAVPAAESASRPDATAIRPSQPSEAPPADSGASEGPPVAVPPRRRGVLAAGLVGVMVLLVVGVLLAVIQPWSGGFGSQAGADAGASGSGQTGQAGGVASAEKSASAKDGGKSSSPSDTQTTAGSDGGDDDGGDTGDGDGGDGG